MVIALSIIALIFFILALILTKKDKTNFIIGIFYEITIILLLMAMYMLYANADIKTTVEFFVRNIMRYVTYIIAVLFIYNGIYNTIYDKITANKVKKSNITDLFSLLAGITLIMINVLASNKNKIIFIITDLLLFYMDTMFIGYIISFIVYNILNKITDYNILIVLGCGLADGIRPTRTMKNRLNKAIKIYNLNKENDIKIIVSGGKGSNEKISEAEAMKKYLVENGIDINKIILEDKSTNTYENLKFSKEQMKKNNLLDKQKIAFVTSDFHVYRTAIYAKQLELKADGIGSKSLIYYYPNAFIREFAAIFVKYKYGILYYIPIFITLLTILLKK